MADKAAFLDLVRWKNPDDKTVGLTRDDTALRQFGDAAVETGRYVVRSASPRRTETRRYTAVWALREGKWLIVHLQFSEPAVGQVEPAQAETGRKP